MHYDHLAYIVAAYGLFAVATVYLAAGAQVRLARVARKMKAVDTRGRG